MAVSAAPRVIAEIAAATSMRHNPTLTDARVAKTGSRKLRRTLK
jgi:hypothetical protein